MKEGIKPLGLGAILLFHFSPITVIMTWLKDSYSFEMCICGTVKCRPTLAYRVHFDSINIRTELITRYYSNEKLAQCCFNVRPTSATLADIKLTFGECAVLAVTQPFVSQHKAHMRGMVNYFLIDVAQVYRVYMTWELVFNAAMGMKRI